jgi:predicted metal-dependent enzyme (double-stranded beta helix superfamily)
MSEQDDDYYVQSPTMRTFIAEVQRVAEAEPERARTVQLLRPVFAELLNDENWLPDRFQQPDPEGGMGEGIGNYLLYRSAARDLTLFSLVLPAGAATPVHDHLTWGLVGLYGGEQEEWIYRRLDGGGDEGSAELVEVEQRHLRAGDFYELLPPDGDIHRVQAVGNSPSVSLHLLGNDIGCTWRHRFEPEEQRVHRFRSSYSNAPCPDEEPPL